MPVAPLNLRQCSCLRSSRSAPVSRCNAAGRRPVRSMQPPVGAPALAEQRDWQSFRSLRDAQHAGLARPLEPRPQPLDQWGCLANTARLEKVPPRWQPLLGAAAAAVQAQLPSEELIGVYLRGSVPQGTAIDGLSDLDVLVLHHSSGGEHAAATHAALAAAAGPLGAGYPFCKKVELRAVPVDASLTVASQLRQLQQGHGSAATLDVAQLPHAFPLKALSVTLAGLDLPQLLAPHAGLPAPMVLPSRAAASAPRLQPPDVGQLLLSMMMPGGLAKQAQDTPGCKAGSDGSSSSGSSSTAQRGCMDHRRLRWCLKRAIRAAFELTLPLQQAYSRDLWHCCALTSQQMPWLEPQLVQALLHYLHATPGDATAMKAAAWSGVRLWEVVRLHFRRQMVTPDASWAAAPRHAAETLPPNRLTALQQRLAARMGLLKFDRPINCPLPELTVQIAGQARVLDWAGLNAAQQAACLQQLAKADAAGEPVLLRGAAADWPAISRWSLNYLASRHGRQRGSVRVSPTLHFPFTERTFDAYCKACPAAVPSCSVGMTLHEFALRMQQGCRLQRRVYKGQAEHVYWQGLVDDRLAADVQGALTDGIASLGLRRVQAPRLWCSPGGAISPTHFDTSSSFLVQVRGRKRMLFWPPAQLQLLYLYPDTHLLHRRARVQPENPDPERFPLFAQAAALEAVLQPGDCVFFPPRWAHYTASETLSMSVTARYL